MFSRLFVIIHIEPTPTVLSPLYVRSAGTLMAVRRRGITAGTSLQHNQFSWRSPYGECQFDGLSGGLNFPIDPATVGSMIWQWRVASEEGDDSPRFQVRHSVRRGEGPLLAINRHRSRVTRTSAYDPKRPWPFQGANHSVGSAPGIKRALSRSRRGARRCRERSSACPLPRRRRRCGRSRPGSLERFPRHGGNRCPIADRPCR